MKKIMVIIFVLMEFMLYPAQKKHIYAPATPASIPLIIACSNLNDAEITIFADHSQANALFLKGDVEILSTGLSVGVELFKNKAPVQIINSYVTGMTYLMTFGKKIESFSEVKGERIYIPFKNSPIDEITNFFIIKEGLKPEDFSIVFSQFPSSAELLKTGKARIVPIPEPFVSSLEKTDNVYISIDYREYWNKLNGKNNGYPQVGTFVKKDWIKKNKNFIKQLNNELDKAVFLIKKDPDSALQQVSGKLKFPNDILKASLKRTFFEMSISYKLKSEINDYYNIIGKNLNEEFEGFYYIY